MAALKNPSPVATVLRPSPNAKPNKLLEQWPPSPRLMLMPKMPKHVASAFGGPPSDAAVDMVRPSKFWEC